MGSWHPKSHDDRPPRRIRREAATRPATLGEILAGPTKWRWLSCERPVLIPPLPTWPHEQWRACGHKAAVAIAPFVIRWGADASSDLLRQCARCTKCGGKGAALTHPSWTNTVTEWQEFPVARMAAVL